MHKKLSRREAQLVSRARREAVQKYKDETTVDHYIKDASGKPMMIDSVTLSALRFFNAVSHGKPGIYFIYEYGTRIALKQ